MSAPAIIRVDRTATCEVQSLAKAAMRAYITKLVHASVEYMEYRIGNNGTDEQRVITAVDVAHARKRYVELRMDLR